MGRSSKKNNEFDLTEPFKVEKDNKFVVCVSAGINHNVVILRKKDSSPYEPKLTEVWGWGSNVNKLFYFYICFKRKKYISHFRKVYN